MDPISAAVLLFLVAAVTAGVLLVRHRRYARAERWMAAASEHPEQADAVDHVVHGTDAKNSTDPRFWEATIEPGVRR